MIERVKEREYGWWAFHAIKMKSINVVLIEDYQNIVTYRWGDLLPNVVLHVAIKLNKIQLHKIKIL